VEPENTLKYAAKWVGKDLATSVKKAALEGFDLSCAELNGASLTGRMIYDPTRVNVAVNDNTITNIVSIG
jgi:hypothetical protein